MLFAGAVSQSPAPMLVVGLGRSGRAAARNLLVAGHAVTGFDELPLEKLDPGVGELVRQGLRLIDRPPGADDLARFGAVVVSPGFAADHPLLLAARGTGVALLSEIDLAPERCAPRAVAVTGSNGKSTTTALLACLLAGDGAEAVACGNIGLPYADAARDDDGRRRYAVELSSFQLESISRARFAAAILLNLQPDHLDRHGSLEAYRAAKFRVARLRLEGAPLVLVDDDPALEPLRRRSAAPVYGVSLERRPAAGGWLADGELHLDLGAGEERLTSAAALPLPGRHNQLNILAAAVVARHAGVSLEGIRRALAGFRGLPHRLQTVATSDGVRWVDDSKATNVGAVLEAIDAFPGGGLLVLLGGRDKDGDFAPLARRLARRGARALVFGEAGPVIARQLEREGDVDFELCATMERAVERAREMARRGDTVLLSPACASFDAFRGFAHRGEVFAALARGERTP